VNDPYAILGVQRDAPLKDIAAAWKRLAKEWHPDLRGDANFLGRMIQANAAYEQIVAERTGRVAPAESTERVPEQESSPRRRGKGWWLDPALRIALGPELLNALRDREDVRHVVPCETGASEAVLVITDRRVIWLRDDHVLGRVRSIPLTSITSVETRPRRRWQSGAALRIRGPGVRTTFSGLRPEVAERIREEVESLRSARS
jgi:hypothetical protein